MNKKKILFLSIGIASAASLGVYLYIRHKKNKESELLKKAVEKMISEYGNITP